MLMADGRSFLYENSYENLGTRSLYVCHKFSCVISSRTSFSCTRNLDGLEQTMFYSVRETWSHVMEMLHRYWLEVHFVFFTIFRCWLLLVVSHFFRLFGHLVDYGLLSGKKIKFEILYCLCHQQHFSYEKLGWFCVRLVYKFLVPSFSHECLVRETWTVYHRLNCPYITQSTCSSVISGLTCEIHRPELAER